MAYILGPDVLDADLFQDLGFFLVLVDINVAPECAQLYALSYDHGQEEEDCEPEQN